MNSALPLEPLARIRIVLSRPSHPGNIGAAARAMKTMGLTRLTLVAPKLFPHPDAEARASGAVDVLAQAVVCATLAEALTGTVLVAGMSARRRDLAAPFRWAREGAAELLAAVQPRSQQGARMNEVALVFGTEAAGLSNDDLALCHFPVMIPANPEYSSLNLGSAVQLMCYELRLAAASPGLPPSSDADLATTEEIEGFHEHLERVAVASGFLDPTQPKRLMHRLRRLFGRVRLEHDEVSILRGLLTTVEKPKYRKKS
ncbi:MAG: RNA methyltransferase [Proteobacteria bacterium]|nr:RNA methyltransferase [Pseudomonadota bacterium]